MSNQHSIDKIRIIFHLYSRWQSITVKSQNCAVTPENSTFLTTSGFILIFVTVVWLPYFPAIAAQNSELSLFRSLLFYTRCPQCSAFVSAMPWCTVVGFFSFNRETTEFFMWTLYSHLFNKRGGWNKRGGGAKLAKSLNVEVGIKVEGGIFWRKKN